jgi:hypothetical protein
MKDIVDLVLETLRNQFTWLTVEREEQTFSYLGMQLIWSAEQVIFDMKYYLQQVLEGVQGLQRKSIPGGRETFQVTAGIESVGTQQVGWYHMITTKLLYLAKRACPDILTFLCTRVTGPTAEDVKKLYNLLRYFHATREKVLVINKRKDLQLKMYVDAAYGLHEKEESHTGAIILFGDTIVYVASRKQKCITKSPTDAEVVAFSDNIDLVSLFHEFAEFLCNATIAKPIIYEDYKACIDLVTGPKGQICTKQICSRIFRTKAFLDVHKVTIAFVNTEDMWADRASKPLSQLGKYSLFARFVLGVSTLSQPVVIADIN